MALLSTVLRIDGLQVVIIQTTIAPHTLMSAGQGPKRCLFSTAPLDHSPSGSFGFTTVDYVLDGRALMPTTDGDRLAAETKLQTELDGPWPSQCESQSVAPRALYHGFARTPSWIGISASPSPTFTSPRVRNCKVSRNV